MHPLECCLSAQSHSAVAAVVVVAAVAVVVVVVVVVVSGCLVWAGVQMIVLAPLLGSERLGS